MKPIAVRRRMAAELLGEGTSKVDELIATGRLKAVKSGKNLLILVESIEIYVQSLPPAKLKLPVHLRRKQKQAKEANGKRRQRETIDAT
jgi:excisionase family DNA binding protein